MGAEYYTEDLDNKRCALVCISKQFELLRYLGSKTHDELYKDLVEQQRALQDL